MRIQEPSLLINFMIEEKIIMDRIESNIFFIGNNFQFVTDVSQLVFEFNNDECRGKVPLLLCCHGSDWAVLQV